MLRIAQMDRVVHHDRSDGAQTLDNIMRFVEPAHMGVAGGENAIRLQESRILLDREEKLGKGLIEELPDKVGGTDDVKSPTNSGARAQTQ